MRLVRISVPETLREDVVDVLRDQQFGYTVVAGAGAQDDHVVVEFVVPADAVEHVLADLEEVGFDERTYTVSIATEFANFEHVDEVQNRSEKTPNRLAPNALRSKAKDLRRNTRSYVWMMVLSAVVATAGLLLGSPAVVVGSMVIAPIVSPVLTAGVGAVRNDRDMFIDSIHMQALGLAVAIVTATLSGWLVRQLEIVPATLAIEQMELVGLRLSPSILAIIVGLAAGAAGAYGLATKGQVTIVGVMIAAALIPTAAAIGIGIAWGNGVVALGALVLLVLTMICVNLGGGSMLYYLDYRPDRVDESLFTFGDTSQAVVVVVTLLFVAGTTVGISGMFYQQSSFERSVNDAVSDVLNRQEYRELGVVSTTIEYTAPTLSDRTRVTVTVSRRANQALSDLPNALDRAITERTGRTVVVRVRSVTYARSNVSATG